MEKLLQKKTVDVGLRKEGRRTGQLKNAHCNGKRWGAGSRQGSTGILGKRKSVVGKTQKAMVVPGRPGAREQVLGEKTPGEKGGSGFPSGPRVASNPAGKRLSLCPFRSREPNRKTATKRTREGGNPPYTTRPAEKKVKETRNKAREKHPMPAICWGPKQKEKHNKKKKKRERNRGAPAPLHGGRQVSSKKRESGNEIDGHRQAAVEKNGKYRGRGKKTSPSKKAQSAAGWELETMNEW